MNTTDNPYGEESDHPAFSSNFQQKIKAAFRQGLLPFAVVRAGGAADPPLHYGVLSVAWETIALLMFVEGFRRQLDRLAVGRPIFIAVLDDVYRELATLGVVELFIHLLHEYYSDLDVEKEAIFTDVHFVFFFTAVFNAFQSTLMAIVAHWISHRIWVRNEEVAIDHYVDIREEFDRVRTKLYGDNPPYSHVSSNIVDTLRNYTDNVQTRQSMHINDRYSWNCMGAFKRFCIRVYCTFKFPRLKAKHDALLVQVRFHDLRIHFLQAYNLPPKLKLSTYLMRSLQAVLKHLIHITPMAWFCLMGLINVLYYLTGVVIEVTKDAGSSSITLAFCFILGMVAFILISLLVYHRMKIIFMQIMEMKHLWAFEGTATAESEAVSRRTSFHYQDGPLHQASQFRDPALASEQRKLFFLGDPTIVIIAIQFMQFGYAITLSVIAVYWEKMKTTGAFPINFYVWVLLGCYTIFVVIMSKTLVRFTMATSLGQLVDRKRLHETVAVYRLEEAERRRQQEGEMNLEFCRDHHQQKMLSPRAIIRQGKVAEKSVFKKTAADCSPPSGEENVDATITSPFVEDPEQPVLAPTTPMTSELIQLPMEEEVPKSDLLIQIPVEEEVPKSDLLGKLIPTTPATKARVPAIPKTKATMEADRATLLMELVKMKTKSLRAAVPIDECQVAEQTDRRRRRKSVSDGVALMNAIGKIGQAVFPTTGGDEINIAKQSTPAPFKTSQMNDIITPQAPPTAFAPRFAADDSALMKGRERHQYRRKAVSASAAIQQMQDFTQEHKEPENLNRTSDVWNSINRNIPSEPLKLIESKMATVSKPTMFASAYRPRVSVDDSRVVPMAVKQQGKRNGRQKALSASAAVRLMQDSLSGDEEFRRDQQSMLEFCVASKQLAVPEGHEDAHDSESMSPKVNVSFKSQQQSELHLQSQSYSALMTEDNNKDDNTMGIPSHEVHSNNTHTTMPTRKPPLTAQQVTFGAMEDSSSMLEFVQASSPGQESPPSNIFPCLDLSPSLLGHGATLQQNSFLSLPPREGDGSFLGKAELAKTDDDDNETVETNKSDGGLSDVENVIGFNAHRIAPHLEGGEEERAGSIATQFAQLNEKARNFYLSKGNALVTHLFGTLMCFFLLGMRIEAFLKKHCIIPMEDATWELDLSHSFWMIVAMLCGFIISSTWRLALFPACLAIPEEEDGGMNKAKRKNWLMLVSSVIDLVICITCLLIFLGAEISRCCNGNENSYAVDDPGSEPASEGEYRFLAGASDYGEGVATTATCQDSTLYCDCLKFGARVEGGLGPIEPWTALIVLRMFRFILGKQIVLRFNLSSKSEGIKGYDDEAGGQKSHSQAHLSSRFGHAGVELQSGTAVELWQTAVLQNPDIVEKYGEFSGELLQAMLGVGVTGCNMRPHPIPTKNDILLSPVETERTLIGGVTRGGATTSSRGNFRRSVSSYEQLPNEPITLDEMYSALAPEIQEIIVAGKLGCPVKSYRNLESLVAQEPSSLNIFSLGQPESGAALEFEVDLLQMEIDHLESTSDFEFPNARLVRSMRRCERKFPPLLTHWSPVDVVITNHEIVYVHTIDNNWADNHHQLREAGQQALVATKGGRGLRLCDVTAGRKVVAHMSLSAIISVHVERVLRRPDSVPVAREVHDMEKHVQVEFWQEGSKTPCEDSEVERQKRWESVHEDSLKIETTAGTLYLRFYSDLEDSEAHPERVILEDDRRHPVFKDIAFQWAQTIIRLCPVGQLKQTFQHYCTNNDAELKDFLQIVTWEEKRNALNHRLFPAAGMLTKNSRQARSPMRRSRCKSELPLFGSEDFGSATLSRRHSNEGVAPPGIPRPHIISRFATYDEGMIRESIYKEVEKDDRGHSIA